jgi:adhesin/invasin
LNSLSAAQSGTDADGKATVTLSGKNPGIATVKASINNTNKSESLFFVNAAISDSKFTWTISPTTEKNYKVKFIAPGDFYFTPNDDSIDFTREIWGNRGRSVLGVPLSFNGNNNDKIKIVFKGLKHNVCGTYTMLNNYVCASADSQTLELFYFDTDNTGVKPGSYSGIIKLKIDNKYKFDISVNLTVAVDASQSILTVPTTGIPADGRSPVEVTFTPKTNSGQMFKGLTNVKFDVTGVDGTKTDVDATETGVKSGVYKAILTAGTTAGVVTVKPKIGNAVVEISKTVTLTAGPLDVAKSGFAVSPDSIAANGITTSTLTFTPKDKNDNPLTGLKDVTFEVTGLTGTKLSAVTETATNSGMYTATLTAGTTVGSATVKPQVAGAAVGTLSGVVTLVADSATAKIAELTVDRTSEVVSADGKDTATYTALVKDANDNIVTGANVNWTTTLNSLSAAQSGTDADGKATVTLSGKNPGIATVSALINSKAVSKNLSFVTAAISDSTFKWVINANNKKYNSPEFSGVAFAFLAKKPTIGPEELSPPANLSSGRGSVLKALLNNSVTREDVTIQFGGMREVPNCNSYPMNVYWWCDNGNVTKLVLDYYEDQNTEVPPGSYSGSINLIGRVSNSDTNITVSVSLTVAVDAGVSTLTVPTNDIHADGTSKAEVTFTPKTNSGQMFKGLTNVKFVVTSVDGTDTYVDATETGVKSGVYKAILTAGTKAGAVTVKPKIGDAVVDISKTVTFVEVPAITGVSVNVATFAVDNGFPTTGFTGAHFTLIVEHGAASDYTWSSSASWAPVDTTGKVSFKSQGNSSPVTIRAEPKAGGTALTYTFTVKSWFSHHGVKPERFSYAMKHCTNRENHVMPVINEMIFSDAPTKRVAGSNKLLSEWGSPGSYSTSEFKIKTAYWLSDPRSGGERLTINPDTGAIRVESVSGWNGFAMCRQELKPLY